MKPDDFEQKLRRQPLRQVPDEWRGEILAAASRASWVAGREPERPYPPTLVACLSAFLWPYPRSWAGLAAVWVVILALDFSARDQTPVTVEKSAPPSPEAVAELEQQRRILTELIGSRDAGDIDRSNPYVPQPRSEWAEILAV